MELADPIGELTIDIDAEIIVPSRPQGRMTMSGGTVGHGELSPRRRNYLEVSIFEV